MSRQGWIRLVGCVSGIILGAFSIFFAYDKQFPSLYELPIFFSPIVTLVVATMTFVTYLFDEDAKVGGYKDGITGCCLLGFVYTGGVCYWLTFFHGWIQHLLLMVALFVGFSAWDSMMLRCVKNERHHREIVTGNRLVNLPTLAAVVLIWLFLKIAPMESLENIPNKPGYKSAQDAFAAGLISFHLFVAAFGYLATGIGRRTEEPSNRLRRFLWRFGQIFLTLFPAEVIGSRPMSPVATGRFEGDALTKDDIREFVTALTIHLENKFGPDDRSPLGDALTAMREFSNEYFRHRNT